jgi:hypothetical protein
MAGDAPHLVSAYLRARRDGCGWPGHERDNQRRDDKAHAQDTTTLGVHLQPSESVAEPYGKLPGRPSLTSSALKPCRAAPVSFTSSLEKLLRMFPIRSQGAVGELTMADAQLFIAISLVEACLLDGLMVAGKWRPQWLRTELSSAFQRNRKAAVG